MRKSSFFETNKCHQKLPGEIWMWIIELFLPNPIYL